jgi:lysine biosynthesis protein LysW
MYFLSIFGVSHDAITKQTRRSDMASTPCSECDEEIEVAVRVRLGQKLVCNHCGAELEVVATDPLEVDIAQDDDDELWDEDELEEDELTATLGEDAEDEDDLDEMDELAELDDFEDDLDDDLEDDDDDYDDYDDFDDDDFDELDDDDGDDDPWS